MLARDDSAIASSWPGWHWIQTIFSTKTDTEVIVHLYAEYGMINIWFGCAFKITGGEINQEKWD